MLMQDWSQEVWEYFGHKEKARKLYKELKAINEKLWDIEDNKRMFEKKKILVKIL